MGKPVPAETGIGEYRHKSYELLPNGTIWPEVGSVAGSCRRSCCDQTEWTRARRRTADTLADRGEHVAECGNRLLGHSDNVVLQIKGLGEQRIGIAGEPIGRRGV